MTDDVIVKPIKPPKPLNARERNFCLNIVKGIKIHEAVHNAGYKMTGQSATNYGCKLLLKDSIKVEIARLSKLHETNTIQDVHTPFINRFDKALETLDELSKNGNDYVRLSATKEILDRVSPKITRNESVKYTLPAKEKERISKLLNRGSVKVVDVTPPSDAIQ
jgi:phage terminase small subunit